MSRRAAWSLLAILSLAAALGGAELLVTATALPSIVQDLASWQQLRQASWIVNGFFVTSIAVMPFAGRAADRYGLVTPLTLALLLFGVASLAAGAAPSLAVLIAARCVQGVGAGAVLPLATYGASHLFRGPARARALGIVGAATFLGMAAGPFLGAFVLQHFDLTAQVAAAGLHGTPIGDLLTPAWRWVFYLAAPAAFLIALYVWAAGPAWPVVERRAARFDLVGGLATTIALAAGLLALTWLGWPDAPGGPAGALVPGLVAAVALAVAILVERRTPDPFLPSGLWRDRALVGAVAISALTGYALATALLGGAVLVDRVRYGGPPDQQLVLGSLALAIAVGAFGSGIVLRRLGPRPVSVVGILIGATGLALLGGVAPTTSTMAVAGALALFGLGFGLTVTPYSAAAVEALGRDAFGLASGVVTQARFLGMGVGVAVLTALGSNRIEALSVVLTDAAARDAVLPAALQGRPLDDPFVVDALERWAAGQAAGILDALFLAGAAVMLLAILPALGLRESPASGQASATVPPSDTIGP
ncbi:MAG: MFS transporter [Candidatus Limnocylindrales bacterium]